MILMLLLLHATELNSLAAVLSMFHSKVSVSAGKKGEKMNESINEQIPLSSSHVSCVLASRSYPRSFTKPIILILTLRHRNL
uniref:Putative secreted protein n=1 Tax=Anopheles triannulatus TaxID=58253 RepID=A0A2M4B407_9DIPT